MKIEVGKEYKTRDGKTMLVVYRSQVDNDLPFLAVNKEDDASWYTDAGHCFRDGHLDGKDLVSPAPKKIKVEGWSNVYPEGGVSLYKNKEAADTWATEKRIACKHIEFEVEEGEGL